MVHGQALGLHLKKKVRNTPPPPPIPRTHETNKGILISYNRFALTNIDDGSVVRGYTPSVFQMNFFPFIVRGFLLNPKNYQ